MPGQLDAIWLGRRRYAEVHALQENLHLARREGRVGDVALFVEHEPVITFGRGAKREHLLLDEAELALRGVEFALTGRGGDVTLHAPGQLVCYPILELPAERRDVRRYVKALTECMRRVVGEYGVAAGGSERNIGLWSDAQSPAYWAGEALATEPVKLGAVGVKISRWVTMHGFALNLDPDLALFGYIVPCGIREYGVSSVRELVGAAPSVEVAAERAFAHLADVLELTASKFELKTPAAFAPEAASLSA